MLDAQQGHLRHAGSGSRLPHAALRAAACAVIAAVALVGCSRPEPTPTPTPSPTTQSPTPSPSPSPSPSPTPEPSPSPSDTGDVIRPPDQIPEQPEAMKEGDRDGAIAAAHYFMDLVTFAYETGNTSPAEEMSDDSCTFCRSVIDEASAIHARGEYRVGADPEWLGEPTHSIRPGSSVHELQLKARQKPGIRYDSAGDEIGHVSGGEFTLLFAVLWHENIWTVLGIRADKHGE